MTPNLQLVFNISAPGSASGTGRKREFLPFRIPSFPTNPNQG